MRFQPRGHVVAVHYPAERDEAREVEIRGLARLLGMRAKELFHDDRPGRSRPNLEIELRSDTPARVVRVPRGHWFVVHPRPRGPLFEVLSDEDFRAAFDGPLPSAESEQDLATAVAAEALGQLGRQVSLRYLDATHLTTGQWAHPAMQAVITRIRAELHERDAELWEQVDAYDLARWDRNRAQLPVPCQVRPELSKDGYHHPGSVRHVVVTRSVRGRREHAADRVLCETKSRPKPMPVGPVTVAPPNCPRCLEHLRSIAQRHGYTVEEPPPAPSSTDDSDKISSKTPTLSAPLPDLGEGWQLVQYTDPDRWWLHEHDRIRGYVHRYTNLSGNKTGWQAFVFAGPGHYMRLSATGAASSNPTSSFLWRSLALAAWGIVTKPKFKAANPAWTRGWRAPRLKAAGERTQRK